jgi:hypothetical protein
MYFPQFLLKRLSLGFHRDYMLYDVWVESFQFVICPEKKYLNSLNSLIKEDLPVQNIPLPV